MTYKQGVILEMTGLNDTMKYSVILRKLLKCDWKSCVASKTTESSNLSLTAKNQRKLRVYQGLC